MTFFFQINSLATEWGQKDVLIYIAWQKSKNYMYQSLTKDVFCNDTFANMELYWLVFISTCMVSYQSYLNTYLILQESVYVLHY